MLLLKFINFLFILLTGIYDIGHVLLEIFHLGWIAWLFACFFVIIACPVAVAGVIPAMVLLLVMSIFCSAESSSCSFQDPWTWAFESYYRLYFLCALIGGPLLGIFLSAIPAMEPAASTPSPDDQHRNEERY
jgi:hypothetical protein